MNTYREITLLPHHEIGHHFLWEKVFGRVHLALVNNKDITGHSKAGITFPQFNVQKRHLGHKIRIFAPDEQIMTALDLERWFSQLSDYVHLQSIKQVPEKVKTNKSYISFYRLQVKTMARVRRHANYYAKQHNIDTGQVMDERRECAPEYTDAPFIRIKSHSTEQRFPLFIMAKMVSNPVNTNLSLYGFSTKNGGGLPFF